MTKPFAQVNGKHRSNQSDYDKDRSGAVDSVVRKMGVMDKVIAYTRKSVQDYRILHEMTPVEIIENYRSVLING